MLLSQKSQYCLSFLLGRINYVCATYSEHFTRRHNGNRHNLKAHKGMSEIVRLIDYLAGRKSGIYEPMSPTWYSDKEKWGIRNSYKIPSISVVRPLLQHRYEDNDDDKPQHSQRILKIRELQSLLHKHSPYLNQLPETILRGVLAYSSAREDDSILDERLEQLRAFDRKH